jgi:hypothetical protein
MNNDELERMKKLLKAALPPVAETEPGRDLWPVLLRQLEKKTPVAWFDWALAAALLALVAFFPAAIPVLLYYL